MHKAAAALRAERAALDEVWRRIYSLPLNRRPRGQPRVHLGFISGDLGYISGTSRVHLGYISGDQVAELHFPELPLRIRAAGFDVSEEEIAEAFGAEGL